MKYYNKVEVQHLMMTKAHFPIVFMKLSKTGKTVLLITVTQYVFPEPAYPNFLGNIMFDL